MIYDILSHQQAKKYFQEVKCSGEVVCRAFISGTQHTKQTIKLLEWKYI